MDKIHNALEFALEVAQNAGKIQLDYFRGKQLNVVTKQNAYDVVTAADRASETIIIESIKNRFPSHSILTEESGNLSQGNDYRWVVDPLDGTTNFSQGLPVFCVSIALEFKERPLIGVVFAPYLRELFYAIKGEGAFFNGTPIHCSAKNKLEESVVSTGLPYDKQVNPDNNLPELVKVAPRVRGLRRMGSAAIDLCYVAAGFYDAYWELNLNRWDVAAGSLIAEEAGAKLVSIRDNRNHSILASAPGIYEEMLKTLTNP